MQSEPATARGTIVYRPIVTDIKLDFTEFGDGRSPASPAGRTVPTHRRTGIVHQCETSWLDRYRPAIVICVQLGTAIDILFIGDRSSVRRTHNAFANVSVNKEGMPE